MSYLSESQRQAVKTVLDNVIEEFGKDCRLFYQANNVEAPTIRLKPAVSTYADSVMSHGGNIPVHGQGEPLENGANKIAQQTSEVIKMSIDWTPRKYIIPVPTSQLPYGYIQCRGYIGDLPKIQKSINIQVQLPIEPYVTGNYKLLGEATDQFNIIQGIYFIAVLERV